jgi:hypothetical protein
LTAKSANAALRYYCERHFSMNRIVDRVMLSAAPTSPFSHADLRNKVSIYVELLSSAGKRDPDELAALGVAYLRKIIDGPDSQFTGC